MWLSGSEAFGPDGSSTYSTASEAVDIDFRTSIDDVRSRGTFTTFTTKRNETRDMKNVLLATA